MQQLEVDRQRITEKHALNIAWARDLQLGEVCLCKAFEGSWKL